MKTSSKKEIIKINGRDGRIEYKDSKSKEAPAFNRNTIKVINELLKGSDNPFYYDEGITTLKTFNDWDEKKIGVSRVANYIAELRKVVPDGYILTFKYLPIYKGKKCVYGLLKDKRAIKFLENLKARIEAELIS